MNTYLIPYKFNNVFINGVNEIDSQKFELPFPVSLSRQTPVAGGEIFDFNYGFGTKLQPKPFRIVMTVSGTTAVNLQQAFDAFFGIPPTGFYGLTKVFIAKAHGSATYFQCDAELSSVAATEDTKFYSDNSLLIANLTVLYKPIGMFELVV